MNAIQVLRRDHQAVDHLFDTYAASSTIGLREELATKLIEELSVHASIEEEFVYKPASTRSPLIEKLVLEAVEEHALVKTSLLHLEGLVAAAKDEAQREEKLDAVVKVLRELVQLHVEQEHRDFFPELERVMSTAELDALGLVLEEARKTAPRFPRLPHPQSSLSRAVDDLVDAGRELLGTASDAFRRI